MCQLHSWTSLSIQRFSIGTTLRLSDVYDSVLDPVSKNKELVLISMVCYYGLHYTAVVYDNKTRNWNLVDDNIIKNANRVQKSKLGMQNLFLKFLWSKSNWGNSYSKTPNNEKIENLRE